MSDTSSTDAGRTDAGRYVAEYVDGPLEGQTEHRFLEDGEVQRTVPQFALVNGSEGMFEYTAGETRELNGERYVRYSLDAADSDVEQGQADPNEESKNL